MKGVFDMLGVRTLNQLLVDIGSGRKASNIVSQSFTESLKKSNRKSQSVSQLTIGSSKEYGAIKFPECCYPISGDPCLAVHNESGITIHRNECQNLKNFLNKPGKCSDVLWEKAEDSEFLTSLTLTLKNEPGALADISKIISKNDSNIQSVATKMLDENFTELTAKLIVRDNEHLELIKAQLKNNRTVTNIERQLA